MACSKSSQQTEGLIINALELDIVIDKILEHLPIRIAAQTSVLSKQWRRSWLTLGSLVFNNDFHKALYNNKEASCTNKDKWSKIICSILLHHIGPVDYFELRNYHEKTETTDYITHSHWLSFLSKNGVKKIFINNACHELDISPYIFCCSELVHLKLFGFSLRHLPTDFRGYRNLKNLALVDFYFAEENSFLSLIENCGMLASLTLVLCRRIKHIVIDFPRLKTLVIRDVELQSLAFRNVQSLESITFFDFENVELIGADSLANSSQLQSVEFDGSLLKLLVTGGILKTLPVTFKFNYLKKLSLTYLDLNDCGIFSSVLRMLESCPYITTLHITLTSGKESDQREPDYNYSCKLAHLREIKIDSMKGSSGELKLIEHLLSISIVLEKLFFKSARNCSSQLKMSRVLLGFPRASARARIVCLDT